MKRVLLITALAAAITCPAAARARGGAEGAESLFAQAPVPDAVLDGMRGGFRLPNGLDVAIGIDIQTRANDVLALHTVYASDGPNRGVHVYAAGTSGADQPGGSMTPPGQIATTPAMVTVTRSPQGTTVVPGWTSSPTTVSVRSTAPSTWFSPSGQTEVPVTVNGPPVTQGAGTYTVSSNDRGLVSTLDAQSLVVQHLVGQASGVVVANTANDRTIDTVATVNVDLQGISPVLTAAFFAVNRVALDAVRR